MANSSRNLHGVTAIVTGSSSGIGRGVALAFAEASMAHVVCVDLGPKPSEWITERLEGIHSTSGLVALDDDRVPTHELIQRRHGTDKASFIACDVSIETASEEKGSSSNCLGVQQMMSEAVKTIGRLDIMVNSAGVGIFGMPTHETPLHVWDQNMSANSTGTFLGVKHALSQFLKQEPDKNNFRGAVINIAGIGANVGIRGCGAYCASKGAMVALTRSVAIDYGKYGIRCNVLCPGYIRTPLLERPLETEDGLAEYLDEWIPMQRIGLPSDVAGAAVWLANGRDSGYITGISLAVDGGFTAR